MSGAVAAVRDRRCLTASDRTFTEVFSSIIYTPFPHPLIPPFNAVVYPTRNRCQ